MSKKKIIAVLAEHQAIYGSVQKAKAMRDLLDGLGLSYGDLLGLIELHNEMGDMAQNALKGFDNGEGWPNV